MYLCIYVWLSSRARKLGKNILQYYCEHFCYNSIVIVFQYPLPIIHNILSIYCSIEHYWQKSVKIRSSRFYFNFTVFVLQSYILKSLFCRSGTDYIPLCVLAGAMDNNNNSTLYLPLSQPLT
jgi:hypothetical protein